MIRLYLKITEIFCVSFSWADSGFCIYWLYNQILIICTITCESPFSSSFTLSCVCLLYSLIMWFIFLSLSLYNLHLFGCVSSNYVVISLLCEFFTPALVDGPFTSILKDNKSPQVSTTLLSIFAEFTNAEIWMVTILPLISNSSNHFFQVFGNSSKRTNQKSP